MSAYKILTLHLLEAAAASFPGVHLALTPGREVCISTKPALLRFNFSHRQESPK